MPVRASLGGAFAAGAVAVGGDFEVAVVFGLLMPIPELSQCVVPLFAHDGLVGDRQVRQETEAGQGR